MDWIKISSAKSSIIHNLLSLSLDQGREPSQKTAEVFNRQSLVSRDLPMKFKDYHYTDVSEEGAAQNQESDIEFMLLLPTQYEQISVVMTVTLKMSTECIIYSSYPCKNYQTLLFTNDQMISLGRYFTLILNSRLGKGWMSTDPESGGIVYKNVNQSLGLLEQRLERAPQELASHLFSQVREIEKIWRKTLPNIFSLLDIWQKKVLNHPYWRLYEEPKHSQRLKEFSLVSDYIKNSFIDEEIMFDETRWSEQKRIRSVFLNIAEKSSKSMFSKSHKDSFQATSSPLTKEILTILEPFFPADIIKEENDRVGRLVDSTEPYFKGLVENSLIVNRNQSKAPIYSIYSRLVLENIYNQKYLAQSNFSNLKIIRFNGVLDEKRNETGELVEKAPRGQYKYQDRFRNQSQVLKIIAPGRCLFVARFFYNEREPIKIYSELCQMKSLDNYISCYRNILSLETKMSLIYRTALGIRFLRDYGIIHNDLKPQNVLLKYMATKKQGYFFPRLIDFGQSQEIPHRGKRKTLPEFRRGYTVPYAPPEQVTSNHYSEKTDVYSLGVMIIEYVFGYFPLEMVRLGKQAYSNGSEELYQRLMTIAPQRLKSFFCPEVMQLLYQLALKCIQPNKQFRPTIDWFIIILRIILQTLQNAAVTLHKSQNSVLAV